VLGLEPVLLLAGDDELDSAEPVGAGALGVLKLVLGVLKLVPLPPALNPPYVVSSPPIPSRSRPNDCQPQ
jgi:hypothetical protein